MEVQREHWTTHQLIVHGSKFFLQICFLGFCISKGRETASFGSLKSAILEREERKQKHQSHIRGLNAFDRHNKSLNEYVSFMGKENLPMRSCWLKWTDTLREGCWLIRSEEDGIDTSWEQRLVKRYYDELLKTDMSHYNIGKVSETSTSHMHRGLIWLRVDKPLSCVKPPMMAMLMSWHLIGSLAALLLMSFERCYVLMMFWLMMRPPRYEEVIIWMELAHQLIDVGADRPS